MLKRIRDIVLTDKPPLDTNCLWVRIIDKGHSYQNKGKGPEYEFLHFVNGDWYPVINAQQAAEYCYTTAEYLIRVVEEKLRDFDKETAIPIEKQMYWDSKQDKLKPGVGIIIENNVISAIGGGGGDATKEDIANLQNQINILGLGAELSISVSPSIVEKNVSSTVKVTATLSKLTPETIKIYADGVEVMQDENKATIVYTNTANFLANVNYNAQASYGTISFSKNATLTVKDAILYGFHANDGTPVLKRVATTAVSNTTYNDTAKIDNAKFSIYVPSGVTAPTKLSMGGTPVAFTKSTQKIGTITYTCFLLDGVYPISKSLQIKAE